MYILSDHEGLRYCGRIDFENVLAPVFVYAGSSVCIRFTGNRIDAVISNQRDYGANYIGYILDGVQGKILLEGNQAKACGSLPDTDSGQDGKQGGECQGEHGAEYAGRRYRYCLGERLEDREHELLLFKRMDSRHYFTLHGFELADGGRVLPAPEIPGRRIEVFGDSVSCGEVSEAVEFVGREDPEHDGEFSNSWYSYCWIAARRLKAELHITSQGGIALLDRTGWFRGPDCLGMESVYDKIQYNPQLGAVKQWDFGSWKPHVAVLAIGQNDANPENYMAQDYASEKAVYWRKHYKAFVERLMALYPKAHFVLTTTILNHDSGWDRAIDDVCEEISSSRVHHFLYERNGCGTPGHIRIPEAEEMAEELCNYLNSLGEAVWED